MCCTGSPSYLIPSQLESLINVPHYVNLNNYAWTFVLVYRLQTDQYVLIRLSRSELHYPQEHEIPPRYLWSTILFWKGSAGGNWRFRIFIKLVYHQSQRQNSSNSLSSSVASTPSSLSRSVLSFLLIPIPAELVHTSSSCRSFADCPPVPPCRSNIDVTSPGPEQHRSISIMSSCLSWCWRCNLNHCSPVPLTLVKSMRQISRPRLFPIRNLRPICGWHHSRLLLSEDVQRGLRSLVRLLRKRKW